MLHRLCKDKASITIAMVTTFLDFTCLQRHAEAFVEQLFHITN
jgi:hypothetical protein